MKKILSILMITGILVSANANGFDKKSAVMGVMAGIYIEKNKENILSWSRLVAYKTLQNEAKKYDCKNEVKPSKNGSAEYVRGLCTYINEKSKKDVLEGLNALSYAVLNTYEDKKGEAMCAASLAYFMSKNYKASALLAEQSKKYSDSNLCKTAQNLIPLGLKMEMKYHGKLEAGNVCVE